MRRLLIYLLLVSGCGLFESESNKDAVDWNCVAALCLSNEIDEETDEAIYEVTNCPNQLYIASEPFIIHASSESAAKFKCVESYPFSEMSITPDTCYCADGDTLPIYSHAPRFP